MFMHYLPRFDIEPGLRYVCRKLYLYIIFSNFYTLIKLISVRSSDIRFKTWFFKFSIEKYKISFTSLVCNKLSFARVRSHSRDSSSLFSIFRMQLIMRLDALHPHYYVSCFRASPFVWRCDATWRAARRLEFCQERERCGNKPLAFPTGDSTEWLCDDDADV